MRLTSSLRFAVVWPRCVEQLAGEAYVLPRDAPGVDAELPTSLGQIRRTLQRREARLEAESMRRRVGQVAAAERPTPHRAGRRQQSPHLLLLRLQLQLRLDLVFARLRRLRRRRVAGRQPLRLRRTQGRHNLTYARTRGVYRVLAKPVGARSSLSPVQVAGTNR